MIEEIGQIEIFSLSLPAKIDQIGGIYTSQGDTC